jgi:2-iminobutanoate/2-iminopropanoate deaminase
MNRTIVSTAQAPEAIGPYSQAIVANGFVFASGQIALDPSTGQIVPGGIEKETERALMNLSAVLEAAGASFATVVKTTIYLTDLADFQIVNRIYAGYVGNAPPARATVQVSALPKGGVVEIDAIALVSSAPAAGGARG